MNEPKRLLAELRSPLAHELLQASRNEQIPDELRARMAHGFAVTLGGTALGAGVALTNQVPGAVTPQAAALLNGGSSAGLATGSVGGGLAAQGSTGVATWGAALWLKGALGVATLSGAVGLGTWLAAPSPVEPAKAGVSAPALISTGVTAPAVAETHPLANPEREGAFTLQREGTDLVTKEPRSSRALSRADVAAESARPRAKTQRSSISEKAVAEPSGDLGREVRLLDAARQAIIAGNIDAAREKLAQYSRAFPNGALRGEAAGLAKAAANAQRVDAWLGTVASSLRTFRRGARRRRLLLGDVADAGQDAPQRRVYRAR